MEVATQSAATDLGGRIIKVNHAGEHGAIAIYTGQILLARLTAPRLVDELREFRSHEQRHRAIFGAELERRGRRRCRSYWLCGMGGFVLGAVTGLCGSAAISATTTAVESVVLRHLVHQLEVLQGHDPAAVAAISSIVAEEQQHHDQALEHVQAGTFWPRVLGPIVSSSTEAVIWLGMRL
ncbi:MAG: demethoxyubiquinone hydroxylase family protein [Stenotrophomonas sp.]|uniref:demethoxyubiquinone hydroxylase family protein n=1 Tax=Stenotrophomonas sp. TaxID=69392 RepID=UPI003D6CA4A1